MIVTAVHKEAADIIQALGEQLDRELDSDRLFFQRRPDRQYRIRRCFPAEAKAFHAMLPKLTVPRGDALFVAVCESEPGLRIRHPFAAGADVDCDMADGLARIVYTNVSGYETGRDAYGAAVAAQRSPAGQRAT